MGTIRNLVTETSIPRHRNLIEALFGMKCENSEESNGRIEWTWEAPDGSDFVNLLNDNKDVKFHKNFSSGTAVVRGAQPMSQDQYFWEVKMISPVYGTDMMVGIGTPDASMAQVTDKFISLLGNDKQTWGLSYTGLFHHNGESRIYASRFGQGSIIGVHLDLWNGTLSFYKNKKHLGIASKGLAGKTLYAMASSTAACSGMRIVRSCSFPSSLQFLCCAKLRELIPDEKSVLKSLSIPPGLKQFLDNNLGWFLGPRFNECVLYPSLPKRSWAFALKPSSEDPLLTDVGRDLTDVGRDEDSGDEENRIMIGGRSFILQCGRRIRPLRSNLHPISPPSSQFGSPSPLLSSPSPQLSSSSPQFSSPSPQFSLRSSPFISRSSPFSSRTSPFSSRTSPFSSQTSPFSYPQLTPPSSAKRGLAGGFLSGTSSAESPNYGSGSQRGLLKDFLSETSESASYCAHSSGQPRGLLKDFSTESESSDAHGSEYQRMKFQDFVNEPSMLATESTSYDNERGLLQDFLIEPDISVECLNYDSMDSLEMIEITDEEDAALESPAKRRCSSYNYIMGLSDPDTDCETAD